MTAAQPVIPPDAIGWPQGCQRNDWRQGQPFDERVFEKIRIFHSRHPNVALQVDGGVSLANAKKLVALDVSTL
ncbi:MAG: hypothetical protein AAB254_03290, partial [candidate division NC10 bacterium]